jgi:flavin-binding protein dodecin
MPDEKTYPGSSKAGFSLAVADAVERAEKDGKLKIDKGKKVTLAVDSMEVDVHGPLGEYRVVLKQT